MSVSNQETVYIYTGNGVTVTFAYSCQVQKLEDLDVYLDNVVITSGITINGIGSLTGGSVTFSVAPASGVEVRVERAIELERTTDYQQNGDFLSRIVNPDFDRLWMALQQIRTAFSRVLHYPRADVNPVSELPLAAARANKLLGFNSNGDPIVVTPIDGSATSVLATLAMPGGSALIGGGVQHVDTIAQLRTVSRANASKFVSVSGYDYYLDAADTTSADNGGEIIVATDGGRWKYRSLRGPAAGFYTANGARPWRNADRLFVGGASVSSGSESPTATESWVTSVWGAHYFERDSQLMVATNPGGMIGVSGVARTSDIQGVNPYEVSIGVVGVVWNNKTDVTHIGWGGYFEAVKENNSGAVYGIEVAVKNRGVNQSRDPYSRANDGGLGIWLPGGGDSSYGGAPLNPCNTAIIVGSNSSTWNVGICFDANAISGTDGVTGTGTAVALAKGHAMTWFSSGATRTASIYSSASGGALKTLRFDTANVYLGLDATAQTLFNFSIPNGAMNGFQFDATATGAGIVSLIAAGSDANLDLALVPKGSGVPRFGLYTSGALSAAGYISIKDAAGNVRRLLVG